MSKPALDIVAAMNSKLLFANWFKGSSWDNWRTVLKGAFALPMSEAERAFFRTVAERDPPAKPARELWCVIGRSGGKDSIASLITAHAAALFDRRDHLRPGERALCMCLACDRDQARIVLGYTRSYFEDIAPFRAMVRRETASGFELDNGVDIAIATNSFRAVRGHTLRLVIMDECAFYRDERSATPDEETYRAVAPGLARLPGSMLIGISTPYAKRGLLYRKFREHYGQNGDVLVIKAPSITFNPTLDQTIIDQALAEDPFAARAEWLGEFRDDVETFISREVVDAAVVAGRHELPRVPGVLYTGATDPSGGSNDSFTLAIDHVETDASGVRRAVLDLVRETKPPFSPDAVVAEYAALLKAYGITRVIGDRYGGMWPRERFAAHGIEYVVADKTASDYYLELLPILNSGRAELLDHPRLVAQLCQLERSAARSGKTNVGHAPNAHDDVINAAAIAMVSALAVPVYQEPPIVMPFVAGVPRYYPGSSEFIGSGAPVSSSVPAASYDYNREQGWKDYVNADGSIRSTPRGGWGFP
jgi:hypothetical protein